MLHHLVWRVPFSSEDSTSNNPLDITFSKGQSRWPKHTVASPVGPGVHLNISTVVKLMARHPSVLPFLVYIPSESRHVERMAVRAKYMTLDPNKNR
jgi:hypothetical protein